MAFFGRRETRTGAALSRVPRSPKRQAGYGWSGAQRARRARTRLAAPPAAASVRAWFQAIHAV